MSIFNYKSSQIRLNGIYVRCRIWFDRCFQSDTELKNIPSGVCDREKTALKLTGAWFDVRLFIVDDLTPKSDLQFQCWSMKDYLIWNKREPVFCNFSAKSSSSARHNICIKFYLSQCLSQLLNCELNSYILTAELRLSKNGISFWHHMSLVAYKVTYFLE